MKHLSIWMALVLAVGLTSCSKEEQQQENSARKAYVGYYSALMPIKHSPTFGPCSGIGGWCVDLDIGPAGDNIPMDFARAGFTYDPSIESLKVTFEAYNPEENLDDVVVYEVDQDKSLPSELTNTLEMPNDAVVPEGIYDLGIDADGNKFITVIIRP
ncbi:MAG: hypothetical protein RLP14_04040 [Owenweeksia sp.]